MALGRDPGLPAQGTDRLEPGQQHVNSMTTSSPTSRPGSPPTGRHRRLVPDDHGAHTVPTHAAFASDPATVSDQYLTLAARWPITASDTLSFWHTRRPGERLRRRRRRGLHQRWQHLDRHRRGGVHRERLQRHASARSSRTRSPAARRSRGSSPYVQVGGQPGRLRGPEHPDAVPRGVGRHRSPDRLDRRRRGDRQRASPRPTTSRWRSPGSPTQSQDVTTQIVAPTATCAGKPTVTGSTPSAGAVRSRSPRELTVAARSPATRRSVSAPTVGSPRPRPGSASPLR